MCSAVIRRNPARAGGCAPVARLALCGAATLWTTGSARAAASGAGTPDNLGMAALLHLSLGLVVVLALIVASAWVFRRLARLPRGAAGALRVLGGLSLGTRERIVLVQAGKDQLLIGVAPGRLRTLHVLSEPIAANGGADDEAAPDGFAGRLAAALGQVRRR